MTRERIYRELARLHAYSIGEDDSTFLEVVENGGHVVEFVAGTLGTKPLRRILARHPIRMARYAGSGSGLPTWLPKAELLSVAVHERVGGNDHAERLFRALERRMQDAGIDRFRVIAEEALAPAHRFYRRIGG